MSAGDRPQAGGAPGTPEKDLRAHLDRWLATQNSSLRVHEVHPLTGGLSSTTVRVQLVGPTATLNAVVRVQGATTASPGMTDVRVLFDLLVALEPLDVLAPRPMWYCEDPAVLGGPFLITEFLDGEVPTPWRPEGRAVIAHARETGTLVDDYVEVLARIHAIPPGVLPAALAHGGSDAAVTHAGRELRRWADVMAGSAAFRDDPVLTYAQSWLAAHQPRSWGTGLVHGDYRPGNLVLRDGKLVGVLDWEFAEAGDPLYDLGWICSPAAQSAGLACGLFTPSEFLQRYERVTGRGVDPVSLRYYTVLATWKNAGVWVQLSLPYEQDPYDIEAVRAGFSVLQLREMLAQVLALPLPPRPVKSTQTVASVLARTQRNVVLPHMTDPRAEREARAVLALLRAAAAAAPVPEQAAFAERIEEFLLTFGRLFPRFDSGKEGTVLQHLGRAVRHAFAEEGAVPAKSEGDVWNELRTLVGWSASVRFGAVWA